MHLMKSGLLLLIGISILSPHLCVAQSPQWSAVQQLTSGQDIKFALRGGGSHRGTFKSANDSGMVIRSGNGEQTLPRDQVTRVLIRSKGHRGRNALIGAGIGAGAGLGAGVEIDNNCSKTSIVCTGSKGKAILTPLFGLLGAGIGALIPSGGWHEVYRSR